MIGILTHDGVVTSYSPITNTLNAVVAKLKKLLGVSIVRWKLHFYDKAWATISSLYLVFPFSTSPTLVRQMHMSLPNPANPGTR